MRVLLCMLRSAIERRDGGAESMRNLIEGLHCLPAMEVTAMSSFGYSPFHRPYAPYPWRDSKVIPLVGYFCRMVRRLAPEYDLIVLVLPNPAFGYLADLIKRLVKKPILVNYESRWHAFNNYRFVGDNLSWRNMGRLIFFNKITSRLAKGVCDKYIVSTHFQKNELTEIGYEKERVIVIPNCTDTSKYSFKSGEKNGDRKSIVLYLGHFNHSKGVDILVRATPSILQCFPQTKVCMISSGSGNEHSRIMKLISKYRIRDNIDLINGTVDVPAYLSRAKILALPYRSLSKTRIIPSLILEAFSVGTPVVVCDCEPIREIIDDYRTGIVVPTNDPDGLSHGITELLKNTDLREHISQSQREVANDHYSHIKVSMKYYQVLTEVLYG